jgi:hypothetical protein
MMAIRVYFNFCKRECGLSILLPHCEPHAGRFMWEVHYSGEAVSGDCFAAHKSWFLRLLRRLAKTGDKLMIFFSMLPVAE